MMKKAAERKQNLMTILVVLMVFAAVVFMGSVLTASADTEADAHLVQNMQKLGILPEKQRGCHESAGRLHHERQ